ncbi:MAG: succinylglutamate desuccinylase/aspartoacylase family protein, partial [Colwellia sp.]|nr:succinylglutamate desuccinylase/aspartoacylase family protein [Colwellia sp.]
YFSSNKFDAHAFTIELGKVKPFGENDMANFADISASLKALISGQALTLTEYNKNNFSFFKVAQTIKRHHQKFTLHFAGDVENFTVFPIGTVIATDGEQQIKTKLQGEAIIFPNANVVIDQRAMLTVVPVEIMAK